MGVESVCRDSSDRKNWDKIFKSLVMILKTKQEQLESLVKDRKMIEDRFKKQHENWVSDVRNYEDQLSLMSKEIETTRMMQMVETAKCNLLVGLKEKDRSLCNFKLEQTMDELIDLKSWFDFLTLSTNIQKDNGNLESVYNKSLETEFRKLRLDYEKLTSQKKCEVSDLLRENGFAWSQFKCVESGFTDKLKRKDEEIAQADAKISSLISHQEQLQSSNDDKDEIISRLKAQVAELETNSAKKDEEISKLSLNLESLKKSRGLTPILTRCTTREKGNTVGSHIATKKEKLAASTPNEQGSKSTKRKRVSETPVSVSEIPKLFTSAFRVPKLKSPSSGAI